MQRAPEALRPGVHYGKLREFLQVALEADMESIWPSHCLASNEHKQQLLRSAGGCLALDTCAGGAL
eukprot:1161052-Pelagomonas_calceolata.AAC.4